jgi:hypothetical protein
MPIVSESRCFVKNGEFVTRTIAGETIIVPVRGRVGDLDAIYNLNNVGGFIWKLLDGQCTLRLIVEAVCTEFDVSPDEAAEDTVEFLSALESAGVVQVSGEGR